MGYVYLLAHERIPGLVKIGHTSTTVEDRVESINGATGVPGKFRVVAAYETDAPADIERRIHLALSHVRLLSNKEFFETSVTHAKTVIEAILSDSEIESRKVTPRPGALLATEAKHLGDAIRAARKARRLTQTELAKLAGCGTRAVVDVEAGKPTSEVGLVLRLAVAAGVQVLIR